MFQNLQLRVLLWDFPWRLFHLSKMMILIPPCLLLLQLFLRLCALIYGVERVHIQRQGLTSAGKTSLGSYLAHLTVSKLICINNHEHTDLSEYLGCMWLRILAPLSSEKGLSFELFEKATG